MSEFSESYHLRTADPAGALRKIRCARISGLAFPASANWLSFVPFENCPTCREKRGVTSALIGAVEEPFLHYRYAEDYGWTFALYRRGQQPITYECWWDPEIHIDRSRLDLNTFVDILSDSDMAAKIRSLLEADGNPESCHSDTAYRFAELLHLPAYKWLSPRYAEKDTDSFMKQGARIVGQRPADVADAVSHPPDRAIKLDRADLSAREAFEISNAYMKSWDPTWFPTYVFCQGGGPVLDEGGRLSVHLGSQWGVEYHHKSIDAYMRMLVWPEGRITASVDRLEITPSDLTVDDLTQFVSSPLPENWIDSTNALALVANELSTFADGTPSLRLMNLQSLPDSPLVWTIIHQWGAWNDRIRTTHFVEAQSATILGQSFEHSRDGKIVEDWVRPR